MKVYPDVEALFLSQIFFRNCAGVGVGKDLYDLTSGVDVDDDQTPGDAAGRA